MNRRIVLPVLCGSILVALAWLGGAGTGPKKAEARWTKIADGVFRSPSDPAGYALVDGDAALLIDAPSAEGLDTLGVAKVERVLLTHYHRPVCAAAAEMRKKDIPVQAAKSAADWLTLEGVKKYWRESLPLRNSRTAYLVLPEGIAGVDCSLVDGQVINWRSWRIEVLDTPGPARSHLTYLAKKGKYNPLFAFCGGLVAEPGKLWAPYATDWDHWTDAGLTPTALSLRKLAARYPDRLLPSHGPVLEKNIGPALRQTAVNVEEAGFFKSFERFTKQRLGNHPKYAFLALEQAESNGSKPWTKVSDHLYLTGNTYVLLSKDNACLMIDPWDKRSSDQFDLLRKEHKLGPLEVVWFSHAHYDHYDGVYHLPERKSFAVWTLDEVAVPLENPFRLRAPFLDVRPIAFDKKPKDGETLTWREYRFKFHHFPGQSYYTMAVETTIDGKRCLFTADNFFHQDMFSGSGGWMGLNRSSPLLYAASARKVLDIAPEWVLAEHGGPFVFDAEDFRHRAQWGEEAGKACDAMCLSGQHRRDWDPHHVRVEPILQRAKAGETLKWTLAVDNPLPRKESLKVKLLGRGVFPDQTWDIGVAAGKTDRRDFTWTVPEAVPAGRHIFALEGRTERALDNADAFLAIDVEPR